MTVEEYKKTFHVGAYLNTPTDGKCCGNCEYAFECRLDGKPSCFNPLISYPEARMLVSYNVVCDNFKFAPQNTDPRLCRPKLGVKGESQ